MSSFFVTLQLLLLLSVLPLLLLSQRTSRAHRRRHGNYVVAASLVGLLTVMAALISLSLWLGDEEGMDGALSFGPPLLTLVAAAWVLRRGLTLPTGRSTRR